MKRAASPRTATEATYVYAVLDSEREPALDGAPAGLPGCGPPRAIDAGGGLWLVAAGAPLRQYDERALERGLKDLEWVGLRAMAHQRVLEHCLRLGTVLPMKLLTLFRTDARAVDHVRKARRSLRAAARRVRGQREWGVRMSLDEEAAARSVRKAAAATGRGAGRGTAYLMRKTQERTLARDRVAEARGEAEKAYAALGRIASAALRRAPASEALLLDATFLVPGKDGRRFEQAVSRLRRTWQARGIVVALTGPWPAYSFVAAR